MRSRCGTAPIRSWRTARRSPTWLSALRRHLGCHVERWMGDEELRRFIWAAGRTHTWNIDWRTDASPRFSSWIAAPKPWVVFARRRKAMCAWHRTACTARRWVACSFGCYWSQRRRSGSNICVARLPPSRIASFGSPRSMNSRLLHPLICKQTPNSAGDSSSVPNSCRPAVLFEDRHI
jgi:hypothetical protein